MIFSQDNATGQVTLSPEGPFVTGSYVTLKLTFTTGVDGLAEGARLRVGVPNTGWEPVVVPQLRYWDELVRGKDRKYAPFHSVNTTADVITQRDAVLHLETMERMLIPDEDPAEAYWRWWITATVEDGPLAGGDQIVLIYGDPRFVRRGVRVQTFPEDGLTISVYVDPGDGNWVRPGGAPVELDVVSGAPARANVVVPSVITGPVPPVRIALTDACHCRPNDDPPRSLVLRDERWRRVGNVRFSGLQPVKVELKNSGAVFEGVTLTDLEGKQIWGTSNPCIHSDEDNLQLFWGDLHAQSEYHVMHSQEKDARQVGWSKGISCGTPDDVYQYARDVTLLDFVAITDQGAITGVGWELLQQKAIEHYRPGEFATFKSYEAGSPVGHRNVYFRGDAVEPLQDPRAFSYMPDFLYEHYRGREDVMMIPHHVKTWTDWSFHDPDLEPLMEIYSCWGQSENPSMDRWDKGMTPGAGAWEALRRGYRLGMIASSDNHVGMPGRSYQHDRQVHTPFPGGLAAVWAPELTREALFDALKSRRCYGTTGARIILDFTLNDQPMGSILEVEGGEVSREVYAYVRGTDAINRVEVVQNGKVVETGTPHHRDRQDVYSLKWRDTTALETNAYYYIRVIQIDGEMGWSSPIWVDRV